MWLSLSLNQAQNYHNYLIDDFLNKTLEKYRPQVEPMKLRDTQFRLNVKTGGFLSLYGTGEIKDMKIDGFTKMARSGNVRQTKIAASQAIMRIPIRFDPLTFDFVGYSTLGAQRYNDRYTGFLDTTEADVDISYDKSKDVISVEPVRFNSFGHLTISRASTKYFNAQLDTAFKKDGLSVLNRIISQALLTAINSMMTYQTQQNSVIKGLLS
ncbi:hypothetical protein HDE_04548 [Halotydeus destructor]|nr:hypothetical protein HDE_04548 [Halotydeus destructor]